MFVEERRNTIVDLVNKKNRASVIELSSFLKVTEATIRRDLCDLEQRELIVRTHGGALRIDKTSREAPLQERVTQRKGQKSRIAQFVSQLVRHGETIMMDGGSTTLLVAEMLVSKSNLMVVTNSPPIGETLAEVNGSRVILVGGELRRRTDSLIGTSAELTLKQFRADKAILGMSGLLVDEGFFSVNPQESEIKRIMARCAKETVVVMDSSKIGKVTFSFVFDFSAVRRLITDSGIAKEDVTRLEEHGIEVITV